MKNTLNVHQMQILLFSFAAFVFSSVLPGIAFGATSGEKHLKPFILAQTIQSTDMNKAITDTKNKLTKNNFQIVGEYSPYKTSHIIIVTNDQLKKYASQSDNGVYGAAQRVTVTLAGNEIQIAFTNPSYMANVYRFKTDLADISQSLKSSLGFEKEYGSDKGLTAAELRDYQYKWLMPYFTDRLELAEYADQQEALAAVNKALADNKGGVSKLYQVDLDGKNATVIGVSMKGSPGNECSGDAYIMDKIDFKKIKSSGHLPYEIIITDGNVYALYAEFRIAINFPDLSMMGENSFMSIMCAPDSIKQALTLGAGGALDD